MERQKLMLFLEGTAFQTKLLPLPFSKTAYAPIGRAVEKINGWHEQYTVVLCTFRRHRLHLVRQALRDYGVTYDALEYRRRGESYGDVVMRVRPDILLEDDCASIGGAKETCIAQVPAAQRQAIRSIVVPEFQGVDEIVLGGKP